MPNRRQTIIWTNAGPVQRRICVALGGDELTHCDQVTPYGDIDQYQHWHQAITWTNVDFSLVRFFAIHVSAKDALLYNESENYNFKTLPPLPVYGLSCVSGFGTAFMFLTPTSICAQNFPGHVRGFIIGLTQSCYMIGPALFGRIYATWFGEGPVGNYFLLLAVVCVAMNLLSMWILRPIPSVNDSEQVRLLESHTVSFIADNNDSSSSGWMECVGLDLMKIPAFHIVSWCFLLPVSMQLVVFTNITTMSASFSYDKLAITLPIWGPVAAFITGLASGFISDLTVKHMSRVFYAFVGNSLQALFFILSIFWGDTASIFTGLVIVAYINNGFLFAIIPTLLSEYFGTHHFMRNWGAVTFINALLSLIIGVIVGALYQTTETNESTECYGLMCFHSMFIIGSVLSASSALLCGIMWHIEHTKMKQQGYERKDWERINFPC